MKKTIAILLALMMCVSILVACGGKEEPQPAPTDPPAEQENEPEKTPEPAPEPQPAEEGRITISSDEWGDISFVVPDNGNYELLLAEPGQDSLELFEKEIHGQKLNYPDQRMTHQKALITGDGFDILIGYLDLLEDTNNSWPTFGMTVRSWYQPDEVTYGGLEGFGYTRDFYMLAFPAITQFGIRMVYILPQLPDDADEFESYQMRDLTGEIIDLPDIYVILDSLEFDGEMISEPRFETEPIVGDLVTVTPTDGWEFSYVDKLSLSVFNLEKEGISNDGSSATYGLIEALVVNYGKSLREVVEDKKGSSSNAEMVQLDNATTNNQEFLVFHIPNRYEFILLTSPESGVLDLDMGGYIELKISFVDDYKVAMKMVESIIVNP